MIAGGGTGGHLYPAIVIGKEILERDPHNKVLIIGAAKESSNPIIEKEGLPFKKISTRGLQRGFSIRTFGFIYHLFVGFIQSARYLFSFYPDVVIGVGGYSSFPPVFLASVAGFPTLIHEQNSTPGLANRILGRLVDRVCLSFPDEEGYFSKEKVILTGNPTRKEIGKMERGESISHFGLEKDRVTILVFGGSRGARSLNLTLVEAVGNLMEIEDRIQLIYATGKEDYEWVSRRMKGIRFPLYLSDFIFDMPFAYGAADLVIGRAGAGTIGEIIRCGLPSILVPYPYATSCHQLNNARLLERIGAAILIEERELSGELLSQKIKELIDDPKRLKEMGERALILSYPDPASKIVDIVSEIATKG